MPSCQKSCNWSQLLPGPQLFPFLCVSWIYTDELVWLRMDRALQVRAILSTRGLTLYNVSRRSGEIFGRSTQFYVPHNLYYDLARTLSTPTIFQLLALSHITDYRLYDWLAVFGFDLDAVSRLQVQIPRHRTIILASTVYDTHAWIPWFAERPDTGPASSIAPLGRFLAWTTPKRASDLLALNSKGFLYAMVGDTDLHAVPYFVPGSIVRVIPQCDDALPHGWNTNGEGPFFLVEHELGWTCSRLRRLEKARVLLLCPQHPCAEFEVDIGKDARILGMIDAEIRPVVSSNPSRQVPMKSAARGKPRLGRLPDQQSGLKDLLKHSRLRVGLSFREASSVSRWIADALSDELYFSAASTLSDYETLSAPPRHIQKILTLCLLYCIDFREFLRVSRLPLDREGHDPMPDELARRLVSSEGHRPHLVSQQGSSRDYQGFLSNLLKQWEEIPLFLRQSLAAITDLKDFSLLDVFWVGGDKAPIHPLLINATLVAVNRRMKKPAPSPVNGPCKRPLYLILKRDGGYLCGPCALREGNLVVDSYPGGPLGLRQFRNDVDAEVIGQVTTILRRLG